MLKNKKAVIFFIIILLLIAGGVFYWWIIKKEVSQVETGWEIKDTPEGKIAENKKEGLVVNVSKEWAAKKDETGVGFFSPEIEFDENGSFLDSMRDKGGCVVGIEVRGGRDTEIEYLENLIKEVQKNPTTLEKQDYSVIVVSDNLALKQTFKKEGEIKYILVEIPLNNNIYSFDSGIIFSEKCIEEFDKILETVSINI